MNRLKSEAAANAELARAAEFAKLAAQYGYRAAMLIQSQKGEAVMTESDVKVSANEWTEKYPGRVWLRIWTPTSGRLRGVRCLFRKTTIEASEDAYEIRFGDLASPVCQQWLKD